jgi:OFA family oxalate/formate antiporter-like MFS transporter
VEKEKKKILIAGICLQFCCGIAYIWSIFQPYVIEEFNMDKASASMPFGMLLAFFTLGNIAGGIFQKKISSEILIITGSVMLSLGFILSSFLGPENGELLNITYGIISGFGCGIAYNTSVATIQKWFPDKRGFVTGILICATGMFGLIMNPIVKVMILEFGFNDAIRNLGIILLIISLTSGIFIKKPREEVVYKKSNNSMVKVFKNKTYYLITFSMMLAVPGYFIVNPMLMTLGVERGLSEGMALSGVMFVAVMNTIGRLVAPWVSDRFGRKNMMMLLFSVNILAVLILTFSENIVFIFAVSVIGLTYGGFMGMYPTITADYFGMENNGINYSMVLIGYGISSIICPYLLKAILHMENGIGISFVIAAFAGILGLLLISRIKRDEKEEVVVEII